MLGFFLDPPLDKEWMNVHVDLAYISMKKITALVTYLMEIGCQWEEFSMHACMAITISLLMCCI